MSTPNTFLDATAWAAVIRDPLVVSRHQSVQEAIALMRPNPASVPASDNGEHQLTQLRDEARLGCVLVVEGDRLVGWLTPAELHQSEAERDWQQVAVAAVMQPAAVTLPAEALSDLFSALRLMQQHHLSYLPLVDADQRPVGLLGIYSVIAYLEQRVRLLEQERGIRCDRHSTEPQEEPQNPTLALTTKAKQEAAFATIACQIHASLNLSDILTTTVQETRSLLGCDRVLIYQLQAPQGLQAPQIGVVVAETCTAEAEEASLLGSSRQFSCFSTNGLDHFCQGKCQVIDDITAADLPPNHQTELTQLGIRAKLMVPVMVGEDLWGLMAMSYRDHAHGWQTHEVELAQRLAVQVAIAIQQATAYERLETELAERQQAEASLQHSETTNHAIVEAIPDLLIRMTVDGHYLDLRSGSAVQVIYPEKDIQATTVYDVLPPALAEERLRYAQLAIATQQLQIYEQELPVNGILCHEEVRITPCGAQDVLVIVRDISDRKQAEMTLLQLNQKLKESDRKFRAIFNNSFQFVGLLTSDGILLEANETALEFGGLRREEILNRPFWEAGWWSYSTATQRQLQDAIRRAAQGEFIRYESEVRGTGDRVAIIDFSLRPLKDEAGTVILLISEGRDITELKQTEAALRQSEAQSRAILAAIPDLMFRLSRKGEYLAYVTNHREKDLVPSDTNPIGEIMYDFMPPEVAVRHTYWLNRALETGELQIYEQEVQIGDRLQYEEVRIVKSGEDEVLFMIRDITEQQAQRRERERAEAALRLLNQSLEAKVAERTEEIWRLSALHRAIVDGTDYAIISTDTEGTILTFNAAAQKMLGYTAAEVVGKQTPTGFHDAEEIRERAVQLSAELGQAIAPGFEVLVAKARRGIVSEAEWQYVRQDGTTFPVLLSVSALMNANQKIGGFVGIAQDITQRKQAEAERDRLLSVLEAGLNEVYIFDAVTLRFCYANPGALNNLGYSLETLKTLTPVDIKPDVTETEFRDLLRPLLAGTTDKLVLECRHQRADGSCYPTEIHLQLHNPDGEALLLAVVLDITERKQTATQLRNLSDRLELALKSAQMGIWDWDIAHEQLLWDERMYELYGVTSQNSNVLRNGRQIWESCLHPDDREAITQALQQVLEAPPETANRSFEAEFRIFLPDGSIRFIKTHSFVQTDEQGKPHRMIGIHFDVSDRKEVERRLQEQNAELARATRLKDEFLANMSHELRTPLNAVLGMTEALQEKIFGEISDRQRQALKTIHQSGMHLLELINDILDLAKIGAGQIELHCTPISIYSLCQASLAFVEQQAIAKHLQLSIDLPPDLPDLMADERRIRQVLINLLSNAVKFTPDGGSVILSVTVCPPDLIPDPLPPGNPPANEWIQFAIQDTGIGIAPEDLDKLFQPFTQIDSALNRQYDGTGLGLALVKQIAELLHGNVDVSSAVGEGSCFSFRLPYHKASLPQLLGQFGGTELAEVGLLPNALPQKPLVLLAEDNDANVSTISSYLKAKGYQIIRARNGEEAIALTAAHHPDVILMDIQMPGMDGLSATRRIRQQPPLKEIPIIAFTALAMEGDRECCLAAGANEYLTKPIQLRQLVLTIHKLLSTAQLNSQLNPQLNPQPDPLQADSLQNN